MDEQAAILLGAGAGAFVAGVGVVIAVMIKLWPGVNSLLKSMRGLSGNFDEALGKRELSESQIDDAPDSGTIRRKTGSFQRDVRSEIEPVVREISAIRGDLEPMRSELARLRVSVDDFVIEQHELRASVDSQASTLASLAREHNVVARRVNEHSAELNVAQAAESTAAGRVTG